MKKIVNILLVCAVLAVIVLVLLSNKRTTERKTLMVADASSAVVVKTAVVKDSNYIVGFSSGGVLEALHDLKFVSDASGRVVDIFAGEGSTVDKGKVLLQLDDEMLRAEAASSGAAFEALKKDYERYKSSNEQGGVTDQQLDNIRMQMVAAESHYITSRRHLADASVKAPVAGTIYRRYVEVGSYVTPGTVLFDIIDYSRLRAICYVTAKQVLEVSREQPVTVECETFPGETFTGKITFIGEKADRSLNFPVEITIAGHKKDLRPGMFITVHFNSGAMKNGILIPRNAISGSVQAAHVFVVSNSVANKRNVIISNMVGGQVEVLRGLHTGDSIVTGGLINVTDGTKVRSIQ